MRRSILGAALMSRNRMPIVFLRRRLNVETLCSSLETGGRVRSTLGCFGQNQHNPFPRKTLGGVARQIQIKHRAAIRSGALSLHPSLFVAPCSHAALLRAEANLSAKRCAENLGDRLLQ